MTDNPELVATADLTPQSPKPINLSSPMAVPALQDQADNLSTMALSPTEDVTIADTTDFSQSAHETSNSQNHASTEPAIFPSDVNVVSGIDATATDSAHGQQAPLAENEEEDDYAKDFDSPEPSTDDQPQDEHRDNSNPAIIDTSKSDIAPNPHSHDDAASASQALPISTTVSDSVNQPASEAPQAASATAPSSSDKMSTVDNSASPEQKAEDDIKSEAEDAIDIQALVDDITARHAAESGEQTAPSASVTTTEPSPSTANQQSSLPPKPPVSQQPTAADMRSEELRRFQPSLSTTMPNATPNTTLAYNYHPSNGPAAGSYAAPHMYSNAGVPPTGQYNIAALPSANDQTLDQSQRYDEFLKEERKYVSEAKWDRFPEGSRLFIGNLSSERVSKKEVFDIFSHYGRLAQISLKQAYGFVQYHTVPEGQAATEALQGMEISGRKIHLEFSRTQKKEGDGDRRGNRGDRGDRGERGGRGGAHQPNDRDRNRFEARRSNGYRPRSPSPSRSGHSRQGSYNRGDRSHWDPPSDHGRRGRSRSPVAYGGGGNNYRRRSPSPYRRGPPTSEADLDIPRRYGPDVPDVQLLLLQDVNRDFVNWVQGAFVERGLKVEVMFLNPRFPRDLVIQRQVVEGVHGVTELDFRSQSLAKIPLQTFDRSTGRHNARFDQYQDLEPKIAAEIVARAKSQSQMQSPTIYGHGQYPPATYPAAPVHIHPQPYPSVPGPAPANLNLGGLDNATLQRVLSAVQGTPGVLGQPHMAAVPGIDVNAVLSALGAGGTAATIPPQQQPLGYPSAPASGNHADQAHVQNIMAQLSRYRQ